LFSPSVLSNAASGHRLPTLQVTLAFVAACGGDREYWERRWRTVSGAVAPPSPPARMLETGSSLPPPAQLPLRPGGFPGQSGPEPQTLLSRQPLVISGPVGVGKTDLALRYAHDLVRLTPDGQLYADLAAPETMSGTDVRRHLLHALVPADQVPDDPGQQGGLYRSLLARRRLVVLLDNVRDEQQIRPLLAETPHGAMIIVSRRPLLGLTDVRHQRVEVLPRPESIARLQALVGDRAWADPRSCGRLAELCGDLPLALDVAARRLAARPDWTVRDVVARCGPATVLDWLRIGDVSVRARLMSAYLELTLPAKGALKQVGRGTPGEVDVAAIAAALRVGVFAADELLEELGNVGLLRSDSRSGRRRTDALLHAFAVEQAIRSTHRVTRIRDGELDLIVP
jgi:DNA polymerase III delta prime subunit